MPVKDIPAIRTQNKFRTDGYVKSLPNKAAKPHKKPTELETSNIKTGLQLSLESTYLSVIFATEKRIDAKIGMKIGGILLINIPFYKSFNFKKILVSSPYFLFHHFFMEADNTNKSIISALNWRYATKIFDPTQKITEDQLNTILEIGRLAPSSVGIEPWKFIVVENAEIRAKLRDASWGQPKVTDAAHIIVFAARTDAENLTAELIDRTAKIQNVDPSTLDGLKQMAQGAIGTRKNADLQAGWLQAQAYIPLGMMVEAASLMGIDNCPMEGFLPDQVDEILGLKAKNLHSVAMLALGYRNPEDPAAKRQKVRRSFDEVIEFVK